MPLRTIRHVISMLLKDPRFVRYAYAMASTVEKTAATPPQAKEPEIPKELVLLLPLRVSDELCPTLTDFKAPICLLALQANVLFRLSRCLFCCRFLSSTLCFEPCEFWKFTCRLFLLTSVFVRISLNLTFILVIYSVFVEKAYSDFWNSSKMNISFVLWPFRFCFLRDYHSETRDSQLKDCQNH